MIWSIGTTLAAKWLPILPKHHQRQARFFTTSAIFRVEAEVTKNFFGSSPASRATTSSREKMLQHVFLYQGHGYSAPCIVQFIDMNLSLAHDKTKKNKKSENPYLLQTIIIETILHFTSSTFVQHIFWGEINNFYKPTQQGES